MSNLSIRGIDPDLATIDEETVEYYCLILDQLKNDLISKILQLAGDRLES